jgi:multidrug resistance efflux pump
VFSLAGCAFLLVDYGEKVTVYGVSEARRPPVMVAAMHEGTLSEIVDRHDAVAAGNIVARIDASVHQKSGRTRASLRAETLRAQLAALVREARYQEEVERLHAGRFARARDALAHELDLAERRLAVRSRQRKMVVEARTSLTRLVDGAHASRAELRRLLSSELAAEEALVTQAQARSRLVRSRQELLDDRRIRLREAELWKLRLALRRAEIVAELRALEEASEIVAVAPSGGRVSDVLVKVGAHVVPGQPLLTLSDGMGAHDVVLAIPGRIFGQVERGHVVHVRYAGFSAQQYGVVRARIESTSGVTRPGPASEPFYRAHARLLETPAFLDKVPDGMRVEADIELMRKAVWRWLVDPVRAAWERL